MASPGKSIQFQGISNAVNAYENKGVPRWALLQGTQFLEKYDGTEIEEGKAQLMAFLKALDKRTNQLATYTLRVYEDLPKGQKIKSNTDFDGSFNFRLVDDMYGETDGRAGLSGIPGTFENRIAGIEEKLDKVLSGAAEDLPPENPLWTIIGRLMEQPDVQRALASKVLGLVDSITSGIGNVFQKPVARVAGVETQAQVNIENERLREAVQILANVDPEIGTHLLQIANVAQKDPNKYRQLIGMLNLL